MLLLWSNMRLLQRQVAIRPLCQKACIENWPAQQMALLALSLKCAFEQQRRSDVSHKDSGAPLALQHGL